MIYLTGDTHAEFTRLSKYLFKAGEGDMLIICGDFGGVWDGSPRENYWLNWMSEKPYTILFCDGNHENFDRLNNYPVKVWNGGKVHEIKPNVLHLMRGQVFNIEGKKFFVMGGARSQDITDGILDIFDPDFKEIKRRFDKANKLYRINHISWWEEEMPSQAEMDEGLSNLQKVNFNVDYIITHCAPSSVQKQLCAYYYTDKLTDYLESIKNMCQFKHWYFGHYHVNKEMSDKFTLLYEDIIPIHATVVE